MSRYNVVPTCDHLPVFQLGQGLVLQDRLDFGFGFLRHSRSFNSIVESSCLAHTTFRIFNPPPHDALHFDQSLSTFQREGHSALLQGRLLTGRDAAVQKLSSIIESVLSWTQITTRVCVPPPQLALHDP